MVSNVQAIVDTAAESLLGLDPESVDELKQVNLAGEKAQESHFDTALENTGFRDTVLKDLSRDPAELVLGLLKAATKKTEARIAEIKQDEDLVRAREAFTTFVHGFLMDGADVFTGNAKQAWLFRERIARQLGAARPGNTVGVATNWADNCYPIRALAENERKDVFEGAELEADQRIEAFRFSPGEANYDQMEASNLLKIPRLDAYFIVGNESTHRLVITRNGSGHVLYDSSNSPIEEDFDRSGMNRLFENLTVYQTRE